MDNLETDFVAPLKPKPQPALMHWDFSFCKRSEYQDTLRPTHEMLRLARINKAATEKQWADVCKMDIDSDEWKTLTDQLDSRGHVHVKRTYWSHDSRWLPLPPEQRTVLITGRGNYYSCMTFEQCMQLANERR